MLALKNILVRVGMDASGITKGCGKVKRDVASMRSSVNSSFDGIHTAANKVNRVLGTLGVGLSIAGIVAFGKSAKAAYEEQAEGETKLQTIMRQRMAASDAEIKSIVDMTAAQQALGIVGDEVQLAGAQQLGTYINQTSSLKTLLPIMNNLIAQQAGYSASTTDATTVGNLMGKAMQGQTTALKRCGITFTEAEAAAMKYGDEEQRAAMLARIITNNVGQMNQALASSPSGRLAQVKNALSDVKEEAGRAVTTSLTVFLPVLNTICRVLATMANLANRVAQALANVFGRTAKSSSAMVSYGGAAAGSMDKLGSSTGSAAAAAKKLTSFSFDTLQKISAPSSSGGGGGGGSDADVSGGSGGISDMGSGAESAGESIGWLEAVLKRLKQTADSLDFTNINNSLKKLKDALAPFNANLGAGLRWIYDKVLEPVAKWTVSNSLPSFLDILAGAFTVLNAVINALKPGAQWLWDSFLAPIARWTGGAIITVLEGIATALTAVGNWISEHTGLVQVLATILGSLGASILIVDGVFKLLISTTFTVTSVISGFKSALALITSPVGLVIAGIAALVAIIVLCVQHWDEIKAAGTAAIEAIKSAWSDVAGWFGERWDAIKTGASALWSSVTTWASDSWTNIKSTWATVKDWFGAVWTGIKTGAESGWAGVKNAWGAVGKWWSTNVTDPISKGFKTCINGVIGFFEGLANKGVDAVNVIINALNGLRWTAPDWVPLIGGQTIGPNIPHAGHISLPRLATGAVLPGGKPYAAIVNDQPVGQTNIESPLSTIIEAMMTALRSYDPGRIAVNVTTRFDGRLAQLARLLSPYIEAEAQRVGGHAVT